MKPVLVVLLRRDCEPKREGESISGSETPSSYQKVGQIRVADRNHYVIGLWWAVEAQEVLSGADWC
jgi:hypothetical protein